MAPEDEREEPEDEQDDGEPEPERVPIELDWGEPGVKKGQ